MHLAENPNYSFEKLSNCIKILTADAVEAAQSGHPGMPLGFSQVMTILAFKFLRFNPHDPTWFNRDRLVLSAGHGSMLLYSFFYLTGYKDFNLESIKTFRQLGSKAAGHPGIALSSAVETSTGPLGQGIANAVGMAIAQKKYQDKLGSNVCNYNIYAIAGDGCLMEGITYEAASIAGHLKLDNLIVLFDNNSISIDGSTSLTVSEDHIKRFQALGFDTFVANGYDDEELSDALSKAIKSNKPCFISCNTIIGKGTNDKAGSKKSHGSPLGPSELEYLKKNIGINLSDRFYVEHNLKLQWENAWKKDKELYTTWQESYQSLSNKHKNYLNKSKLFLPNTINNVEKPEATRVSSGRIVQNLLELNDKLIIGSADLADSNCLHHTICQPITKDNFSGNFIHYGVREHAMAAIMNGLALSGFAVIGGTFFVFSDYMRPAIRLAAMMKLPIIYVMTHDSIGVGEDGPTHQPIEHLASFRAMPNINIFRPADFCEVLECYKLAISTTTTPAILALSRQSVPQLGNIGDNNKSEKGAYILKETTRTGDIDVALYASGSEVSIALGVQHELETKQISSRVISVPCFELFDRQDNSYKKSLRGNTKLLVAIEAANEFGWQKIIGLDGLFCGINSFGASAPAKDLFSYFDLTAEKITHRIVHYLSKTDSK